MFLNFEFQITLKRQPLPTLDSILCLKHDLHCLLYIINENIYIKNISLFSLLCSDILCSQAVPAHELSVTIGIRSSSLDVARGKIVVGNVGIIGGRGFLGALSFLQFHLTNTPVFHPLFHDISYSHSFHGILRLIHTSSFCGSRVSPCVTMPHPPL